MSGDCQQDTNFWCPLRSAECDKGKLTRPCVLLHSATHASIALAQLGFSYLLEQGAMPLRKDGQKVCLSDILTKLKTN